MDPRPELFDELFDQRRVADRLERQRRRRSGFSGRLMDPVGSEPGPTVTLKLRDDLVTALQGGEAGTNAEQAAWHFRRFLHSIGAELRFNAPDASRALQRYVQCRIPAGIDADATVDKLAQLDGVLGAYIKPDEEAP